MTIRYRVTRDVRSDAPNNWAGRDVQAGEMFSEYEGCTYGSCDLRGGVVLARGNNTFFEFPKSAVERVP